MKDISVIIPCYNEEVIIKKSYNKLKSALKNKKYNYELIFCNDGSTDETLKILKRISSIDPTIKIISYSKNKGPGYAYKELYKAASGNVVIQMDADMAMDPKETISRFMDEIKDYDVVVGSRYCGIKADYPFYRNITSRIYFGMNKLLFNFELADTQSGFFAFRNHVLSQLQLKSNGFEIHIELFDQIHKKNFKIKEIPFKFIHNTTSGETSILTEGPKILINTIKIWYNLRLK
jgi:glycosyltransferase involved in cell wall biosynthesis